MRMLAYVIGRIFDPFLCLTAVFFIHFYRNPIFAPALILCILLPFALYVLAWKTRMISNWDVRDRSERPRLLWSIIAIETVAMILLHTTVFVPLLVAIIGFTVITHWWKISGHAMAVSYAAGTVLLTYGWRFWPVLLLIPIVGWARVVTKNHTVLQVCVGSLYSFLLLAVFFL